MQRNESLERFDESLKRAVSRCKEIALQSHPLWENIAKSLDEIRIKGVNFANASGRTTSQINDDIKAHTGVMVEKQETIH